MLTRSSMPPRRAWYPTLPKLSPDRARLQRTPHRARLQRTPDRSRLRGTPHRSPSRLSHRRPGLPLRLVLASQAGGSARLRNRLRSSRPNQMRQLKPPRRKPTRRKPARRKPARRKPARRKPPRRPAHPLRAPPQPTRRQVTALQAR